MSPRLFLFAAAIVLGGWLIARLIRTLRFSLQSKVVLITGGSRGLGLVIARQICDAGGQVVLIARDAAELSRAKSDLAAHGSEVLIVPCDLLDPAQIKFAVQQAIEVFRKIDIVINNAGIIQVGPLDHMQREDFEQTMLVHFWASYELIVQVVPEMRKHGGGRIVNISSIGGKIGVPHLAPYCASKFALTGFSDSIRAELARDNIYVTTVAPGMMRTGSHVNAQFKGKHDAEFAWFAISSGMPLVSMKAERAARKILAACRRGQSSLTLTFAARAMIVGNAIAPNFTGYVMKLVNWFLPKPGDSHGDESESGWKSKLRNGTPPWLTRLADRASERNNETPRPNAA
jgi:NAD(P)-dependent dehydrogenase (short-subunit alcohol dehydrogenase family)